MRPVIYWFQSYLTFDFPLQLGFNLHFSTLASTIQLPKGFLLKAASDIKYPAQLLWNHSNPILSILVFRGTLNPLVFCNIL